MKPYDCRYLRNRARCLRALVCSLGLGIAGFANAQAQLSSKAAVAVAQSGGYVVRAGLAANDAARTYSLLTGAAGIAANESLMVAGRAGPLALSVVSTVTSRAALGAVVRCVSLSVPICAAGAAAALLYDHYRSRPAPGGGGGLVTDFGRPPVDRQRDVFTTPFGDGTQFPDPQSAADDTGTKVWRNVGDGSGTAYCEVTPFVDGQVTIGYRCFSTALGYLDFQGFSMTRKPGTVKECDKVGGLPVRASGDGLCETGVTRPDTPGDLDQRAANVPLPAPAKLLEPLKQALAGGQSLPADVAVTGPSQVVGPKAVTQTEVSPAGVTKTEVQPVEKYKYEGEVITATRGDITTVTHPDGTTTTTTASATPEPAPDPCVEDPLRLGCLKLGDPPTDVVGKATRDLTYSSESVVFASGCPSPTPIASSLFMSWQPACDAAIGMRPYVLVGAAFSALMLLLAGVRQV